MRRIVLIVALLVLLIETHAQNLNGVIKGRVVDKDLKTGLIGANILILNQEDPKGTATDLEGYFEITNIPAGRHNLRVTYLGYETRTLNNIEVKGSKEVVLEIELIESVSEVEEVVVTAEQNKAIAENEMATVSARTFSVEESQRYAGARNDVARMASNFAGVQSTNDAVNDIVIRGNSAFGLLWRLEGVDIPNPNHFGDFGSTGGPVSMLNNNVLSNSEFYTGAFPAEYGNAYSGVFDLSMRNGNYDKHEFLGQVGFNGFEIGAEGPISKKNRSSYLVNYRYSTLGLLQNLGMSVGTGQAVPYYQDLTFKLNFPMKKGNLSIFGLGGRSNIDLLGSEIDTTDEENLYGDNNLDIYNRNSVGVVGATYKKLLNNGHFNITLAATGSATETTLDTVDFETRVPYEFGYDNLTNTSIFTSIFYKHKFSAKSNMRAGFYARSISFDLLSQQKQEGGEYVNLIDDNGTTYLLQPYTEWQYRFNEKLTLNTGIHVQYLTLNDQYSIEPRVGFKYEHNIRNTFSLGYGSHGKHLPVNVYFGKIETSENVYEEVNRNLDFINAHHLVAGWDHSISEFTRIKTEVYGQYIQKAPVSNISSPVSLINYGMPPFSYPDSLENYVSEGDGFNIGIELTLERFLNDGFYYLLTASLYQSRYRGSDEKWRNTVFNNNYVVNGLIGKEFKLFKEERRNSKKMLNYLVVDLKSTIAGGQRYTPINLEASKKERETLYELDRMNESQFDPYFRTDLNIGWKGVSKKFTQEFTLLIQNVSNSTNFLMQRYDPFQNRVINVEQLGMLVIPQYRITF